MFIMSYTFDHEEITSSFPANHDIEGLSEIVFIEALSADELKKKPYLKMDQNEMATALFFAENDDIVIIIGQEEHKKSEEWKILQDLKNVGFCEKVKMSKDLYEIVTKLLEKNKSQD